MKNALQQGQVVPLMEAFTPYRARAITVPPILFVLGFNVGCHWCDVKESWDAEKH